MTFRKIFVSSDHKKWRDTPSFPTDDSRRGNVSTMRRPGYLFYTNFIAYDKFVENIPQTMHVRYISPIQQYCWQSVYIDIYDFNVENCLHTHKNW